MYHRPLICCVAVLAAGCSQATSPSQIAGPPAAPAAPSATPVQAAAPKAAPSAPAPAATPAPAPDPTAPVTQYVGNAQFERWTGALPQYWVAPEGSIAKSVTAVTGVAAAEILKSDKLIVLEQPLKQVPASTDLWLQAQIKGGARNDAALKVVYKANGKEEVQSKDYTGKGEWEHVGFAVTLPADYEPTSLRVQVLRRTNAKESILVDDVTLSPLKK